MFNTLIFLAFLSRGQPPSGGCVLKQVPNALVDDLMAQPPSGGCVLKRLSASTTQPLKQAATFGWLCVETAGTVLTRP